MSQRMRLGWGLAALLVLAGFMVWQGSFSFGDYGPTTAIQTYIFWGLSTLNFLLTVLVGYMLFRDVAKLYFARRAGQEGSRIRTKIVVGAMTLCLLPAVFLVIWSVHVLNRNLDKWFSLPAESIKDNLSEIGEVLERESQRNAGALAARLADSEALRQFMRGGPRPEEWLKGICAAPGVTEIAVKTKEGGRIVLCAVAPPVPRPGQAGPGRELQAVAAMPEGASVVVRSQVGVDMARSETMIRGEVDRYFQFTVGRKEMRTFYLQLLMLITLFLLFVALWVGMFLARQITTPLSALLEAARAVRSGDLARRVDVPATDEFATLVRAFNEMTQGLEGNRAELERRRRFIEAVLESIPTGVLSYGANGEARPLNRALGQFLPVERLKAGETMEEVAGPDLAREFARLRNRARRTGVATRQLEMNTERGTRQVAVTAAALGEGAATGVIYVLEDTSEILQAQRAAAWHEVARRIAHELKNPLTPIGLCAERIARQLEKVEGPPEVKRILAECSATIGREVGSVKSLVDEFSQFARFPQAHPVRGDLNEVVEAGLAVFSGRLAGVEVRRELDASLPPVPIDAEQFKRVVVNLVDNAAEAMQDTPLKRLWISTSAPAPEVVELVVADTGCGFKSEDKEKLFLPYFSTKQRGTGLGLAIVSHIVSEHRAQIRVEDNQPAGARFVIELPVWSEAEETASKEAVPV